MTAEEAKKIASEVEERIVKRNIELAKSLSFRESADEDIKKGSRKRELYLFS